MLYRALREFYGSIKKMLINIFTFSSDTLGDLYTAPPV